MKHNQNASMIVDAVTAQYDFWPVTCEGENLFSVRAGIPLSDAFNELSLLIGSCIESINLLACEEEVDSIPAALWQSVHQLRFSSALVQSMHGGYMAAKREACPVTAMSPNGGED